MNIKKLISLSIICLVMCFLLTGCGENNEKQTTTKNDKTDTQTEQQEEQQTEQSTTEEIRPDIKIANTWMSMPENVDMYWKSDSIYEDDYELFTENKRGNDVMRYGERVTNGVHVDGSNGLFTNYYYYYKYQGDYKWPSYVYYYNQGWDYWYFTGNYPASPQVFCFGRPWNILDNYSDEHETITIEGVGEVDTVKGVDDEGYTYYYSKDLNMNVKIENEVQVWSLIRFDANVTTGFPHPLPDTEALEAKRAADKAAAEAAAENEDNSNTEDTIPDVYEDENGELVVFDE